MKYYSDDSFLDKFSEFWYQCIDNSRGVYARNRINWWMDFKYKFKMFYIKLSREKLVFERRHNQILVNGEQNAANLLRSNPSSSVLINNYNKMKKTLMDSKIKSVKEKIFKR